MGRPWLLVLVLCLGLRLAGAENHAYHGLWGGLFRQQDGAAGAADAGAAAALHAALADLQSRLLARLAVGADAADTSRSSTSSSSASTAAMLEGLLGGEQLEGGVNASLARLHDLLHPADADAHLSAGEARELAAAAALQGWVLGAAAGSAAAAAGGLALHAAAGAQPAGGLGGLAAGGPAIDGPTWEAFKPQTCLRLQNFGNAEGYHAALLGAAPCATLAARAPAGGALTSEALPWGTHAAFLLECSRLGDGSSSGGDGSSADSGGEPAGGGTVLGGMLQAGAAAAAQAAAGVAAALDVRRTCRLALSSSGGGGGGGGAHLEYNFERPLLGAPKVNAARLRLCNLPPSNMQFPAALARGPTFALSNLRLNGRPLLPEPLAVPQAAAGDGCAVRLLRLSSQATGARAGFVLSGWLALGGEAAGAAGGASSGLGVGQMASLEVTLGSYTLLDAATSRLFPAAGGGGGAAAAAQQPQQP